MKKDQKNLLLIAAGVAVVWFLIRKKKTDQKKTTGQPGSTVMQSAARALSAQLDNVNFIPANETDRKQYANDQKLCK